MMGRLFSASDDGKIFLWDLHADKLMQKYENFKQHGNLNGIPNEEGGRKKNRSNID